MGWKLELPKQMNDSKNKQQKSWQCDVQVIREFTVFLWYMYHHVSCFVLVLLFLPWCLSRFGDLTYHTYVTNTWRAKMFWVMAHCFMINTYKHVTVWLRVLQPWCVQLCISLSHGTKMLSSVSRIFTCVTHPMMFNGFLYLKRFGARFVFWFDMCFCFGHFVQTWLKDQWFWRVFF